MPFTSDQFEMVPESQFGIEHLRSHPVWARFYEPDDIDVAVSWGIDRGRFTQLLERFHDGSDHAMFPVLAFEPLPDDVLDVYVRSWFTPFRGDDIDGYIDAEGLFVCLYPDDATFFSFTSNGIRLADELRRFQLRSPSVTLFPLRFSTPYRRADGTQLVGVFDPR
ncbi:MAG: hypothetical protein ACYTGL_26295 [Planctomycetota bacterium]|jgi:hypothetical protein